MLKDLKSFYHNRLKEINKLHEFRLDFTDGCKLRSFKDEEQKGPDEYNVVFYNIFQKKKLYLNNNPDNLGIVPEMAEFSETIQKRENVNSWLPVGNWYMPYFIRYLKPIFVDVFYDEILVFSDALDCKHKLINFELFPNNSPIRSEHSGGIILFFSCKLPPDLYLGYAKCVNIFNFS